MYKFLALELREGILRVPAADKRRTEYKVFKKQMLQLQKAWKNGLLVVDTVGRNHDDYCDSLALANWVSRAFYEIIGSEYNIWYRN